MKMIFDITRTWLEQFSIKMEGNSGRPMSPIRLGDEFSVKFRKTKTKVIALLQTKDVNNPVNQTKTGSTVRHVTVAGAKLGFGTFLNKVQSVGRQNSELR